MDRYRFFGANTDADISAIHGPIADTDISKIFKSWFRFISKNTMYSMLYLFFKNFKNRDLWAEIFQIAAISIFCYDF